ncbi:MAG TPA: hypothetical protein VFW66_06880 [Gemmatimonadales bacterium]|nr:hypothetical protein [Gemmatimonadales bacterium]
MHDDERLPWESDGDLPWEGRSAAWEPDAAETWRGDIHLREWPEELAGPEYWLYKKLDEDGT